MAAPHHPAFPAGTRTRYLHLVPDEKFIDGARELFESVAAGAHTFVRLGPQTDLRYIKTFNPEHWTMRQILDPEYLSRLSRYSAVIIHFLTHESRLVVRNAPVDVRFVWIGWGRDYYHFIADRRELCLPATRQLLARESFVSRARKVSLKWPFSAMGRPEWWWRQLGNLKLRFGGVGRGGRRELELINKISFFAPVLPDDYDTIRDSIEGFAPEYISWNYPLSFGDAIQMSSPAKTDECRILLGNSAIIENNHLDAFTVLRGLPEHCEIVCPLSYGSESYANEVARRGKELFGPRFRPLLEYMQLEDYLAVLQSCSIGVMNHVRQQGFGNILVMLWLGKRIYLRSENPIYNFLVREGAAIFTIDELAAGEHSVFQPLDPHVVRTNKDVVMRHFGKEAAIEKTARLLQKVSELSPRG